MKKHRCQIVFLLVFGILISFCPIRTSTGTPSRRKQIQDVLRRVRPAFVFIGGGSGAVISPDGYLVTNAHVVKDNKQFTVRLGNGESHEAHVVGLNKRGDLALMKIDGGEGLPHVELGDSTQMAVGDYCMAIGNPLALGLIDQTPTVSIGVLSTKHLFRGTYNDALVTDAPVNPGNSGGPLLNMDGKIIGIIGQIETRWGLRANTGIGLAISADQIKRWLPKLRKAEGENVPRGYLRGIQWKARRAKKRPGAPIKDVAKGSPAAAEDLKGGDIVIGVNGLDVWNVDRFRGILAGYPTDTKITLRVHREGETRKIDVRLRKPAEPGFKLEMGEVNDKKKVLIKKVIKGSAAARAGLKEGDILVAVGARELSGSPDHQKYMAIIALRRMFALNRQIVLTIKRQKNEKMVKKTIRFFPGGEE